MDKADLGTVYQKKRRAAWQKRLGDGVWSGGAIFGAPEDKIDVEAYVAAAVAAGEAPAPRLPAGLPCDARAVK